MNDVGLGLHSKSIIMASNSTKENIVLSMFGLGIITLPPPPKKNTLFSSFLLVFCFVLMTLSGWDHICKHVNKIFAYPNLRY